MASQVLSALAHLAPDLVLVRPGVLCALWHASRAEPCCAFLAACACALSHVPCANARSRMRHAVCAEPCSAHVVWHALNRGVLCVLRPA